MSRIKIPVVLMELYGVPAPKALGLRVLEAGEPKEYEQSGKFLGHFIHYTHDLRAQLKAEGYGLVEIHEKRRRKAGAGSEAPKTTPVPYLTFQLGASDLEIDGLDQWLGRVLADEKAIDLYLNQPNGKPAMLSINIAHAKKFVQRGETTVRREGITFMALSELVLVDDLAQLTPDQIRAWTHLNDDLLDTP